MSDIKNFDKEYIAGTYGRYDVVFTKGKGSKLYDEDGKEYIDLGTGIAVNGFGVADDEWKKAVIDQLDALPHASNLYFTKPQAELAKLLCKKTGMKKVFFSNSGAEANECAIKVARKYNSDKYGENARNTIITLENSFHGRTVTTLAATGQDHFHKSFGPFTEGFVYAKANDFDSVQELADKYPVGAIMMELVQGEGGVNSLSKEFVSKVSDLCSEKDLILIIDEVQTGNGRTGSLYAYQQFGITPDVVSTAKGLAGGLPFGATMMGQKCENVLAAGDHGSTFGGNPVCAAGALSILSRIDDKLLEGVKERNKLIIDTLSPLSKVKSITGMGLMLGIEVDGDAKALSKLFLEKGLVVLTAKTKLRLLPALNIPIDELKAGLSIMAAELN